MGFYVNAGSFLLYFPFVQIQETKQEIEMLKKSIPPHGIDHLKPKEIIASPSGRINARWTQEELMFASQGVYNMI